MRGPPAAPAPDPRQLGHHEALQRRGRRGQHEDLAIAIHELGHLEQCPRSGRHPAPPESPPLAGLSQSGDILEELAHVECRLHLNHELGDVLPSVLEGVTNTRRHGQAIAWPGLALLAG
jgi:hypothetical protein